MFHIYIEGGAPRLTPPPILLRNHGARERIPEPDLFRAKTHSYSSLWFYYISQGMYLDQWIHKSRFFNSLDYPLGMQLGLWIHETHFLIIWTGSVRECNQLHRVVESNALISGLDSVSKYNWVYGFVKLNSRIHELASVRECNWLIDTWNYTLRFLELDPSGNATGW